MNTTVAKIENKLVKNILLFITDFIRTIWHVIKVLTVYSVIPASIIVTPIVFAFIPEGSIISLGAFPVFLEMYRSYTCSKFFKNCC